MPLALLLLVLRFGSVVAVEEQGPVSCPEIACQALAKQKHYNQRKCGSACGLCAHVCVNGCMTPRKKKRETLADTHSHTHIHTLTFTHTNTLSHTLTHTNLIFLGGLGGRRCSEKWSSSLG